jgi:hypothetical protein
MAEIITHPSRLDHGNLLRLANAVSELAEIAGMRSGVCGGVAQ